MRTIYFLFFGAIIALCSCSSAYKSGQTPDDVYYSPGNQRTAVSNNSNSNTQDEYYDANPNDQYLMMRVQDPNRWSAFDSYDYDYGFSGYYNPYSYGTYAMYGGFYPGIGMGIGYGYWNPYYSYINSYYAWNSFYNPYYGGSVIVVGYEVSYLQWIFTGTPVQHSRLYKYVPSTAAIQELPRVFMPLRHPAAA